MVAIVSTDLDLSLNCLCGTVLVHMRMIDSNYKKSEMLSEITLFIIYFSSFVLQLPSCILTTSSIARSSLHDVHMALSRVWLANCCTCFSMPPSSLTNSNSCVLPAVFVLSLRPAIAMSSPIVERLRHINGMPFVHCHTRWLNCWFFRVLSTGKCG